MQKLNDSTDCEKYLEYGYLTKPFLSDDFVIDKVMTDFNIKKSKGINITKIESLYNWLHYCMTTTKDEQLKLEFKFQRSAEEIWKSGFCTGCTDWAILFATLARQIGLSTTFLHTAEYNWVKNLQNNVKQPIHIGHSFCECFYEGKWLLVDPTFRKIEENYNCNKIVLSYQVSNSDTYIPYFRGLDLGKKQSIMEHNLDMDGDCINLEI